MIPITVHITVAIVCFIGGTITGVLVQSIRDYSRVKTIIEVSENKIKAHDDHAKMYRDKLVKALNKNADLRVMLNGKK